MTPRSARLIRWGLLAFVFGTMAAVWATLRKPAPEAAPEARPPGASAAPGPQMVGVKYVGLRGDKESYVLEAERSLGQKPDELRLGGVELTFHYASRGSRGTGVITSDECVYTPSLQKAVFTGDVRLTTEDGLELRTGSLVYRGDRELAKSDEPVEFQRRAVSGSSHGMIYQAAEGMLQLPENAYIRVENENEPPTVIRSGRAIVEREDDKIRFLDGVQATQGGDTLTAERLVLDFSWDDQRITRAQAIENVVLNMTGAQPLPGTARPPHATGPKHLKCWRLDLSFRPDRSLEQAEALNNVELTMMPAPGEPAERRRLRGQDLSFHFNEQRQLDRVTGLSGSLMEVEPLDPAAGPPRTMQSRIFVARIEPGTGETQRIDFRQGAEFSRGGQKATAQEAWYQGPTSTLHLKGSPLLVDEEQGSRLFANVIDVGTQNGDISARENVRHLLEPKGESRGGLLGRKDAPALLTSRSFTYDGQARLAKYKERALLRSGGDEVRAPEIRIQETKGGRRTLTATGGVVSLLTPREEKPGEKPAATVEGRAREMVYDETRSQIAYTGDVVIRQGDITTRSPAATMTLAADGRTLQTLVAGEPVEMEQGERRATGTRGTYTLPSETLTLVGERVVLKDTAREVSGRSLTFHVGDDRILVDGREEARTETIFRKEPPKP